MLRTGSLAALFFLAGGCGEVANMAQPEPDLSVLPDLSTPPDPGDLSMVMEVPPDSGYTPPPMCTANASCLVNSDPGICVNGVCSACLDGTDDAQCVTAYGAGFKCVSGLCKLAGCLTNGDCGSGQTCDSQTNACVACKVNEDCDGSLVCKTGQCVPLAMVDPTDVIADTTDCGGVRILGECCSDSSTCDGTLHVSVSPMVGSVACAKLPLVLTDIYVDPGAVDNGTGTQACPFKTLHRALLAMRGLPNGHPATKVVIHTTGTIDSESFPKSVPTNVTINGDGTWKSGGTMRTTISVPAGATGFKFTDPGPAGINHVNLISQNPDTGRTYNGLYIVNTGNSEVVTVQHATIQHFGNGISVDENGYLEMGQDGSCSKNGTGLLVAGDIGGFAHVKNDSTDASQKTYFSNNDFAGIKVAAHGKLSIAGVTVVNPMLSYDKSIRASNNGTNGVAIYSSVISEIRNFFASQNANSGLYVANLGGVWTFDSAYNANGGYGVFVGGNDVALSSQVNLGDDINEGGNRFFNNTNGGVYRDYPAFPAPLSFTFVPEHQLYAKGNLWKALSGSIKDCRGTPTDKLYDCTAPGGDFCDTVRGYEQSEDRRWIKGTCGYQ
jgi:hypothetical protein